MKPLLTREEKTIIHDIYNRLATDPTYKITENDAKIMGGVMERTSEDAPADVEFSVDQLRSIKYVVEQVIKSIPPEKLVEVPLFSVIANKVSKYVK